jgi:hypothetical protein
MNAQELEGCSRTELIARAESIGVDNAKVLTRAELIDEILRRTVSDPLERRLARGLLGVARDLVARVVERGLHLPDAAAVIRGNRTKPVMSDERPPIATVTLAEIYAGQGHRERALQVLDQVLSHEPEHAAARALRDRVAASPNDNAEQAVDNVVSATPSAAEQAADNVVSAMPPAADEDTSALASAADEDPPTAPSAADASALASAADAAQSEPSTPSEPAADAAPAPVVLVAAVSASAEPAFADEPAGMLDDAPLPTHYDVDEVVLMPVDPATVFFYWEVREATRAAAAAVAPDGRLVLRILAVTPSPSGPELSMRDVALPSLVGDWLVRDMPVGAVLRAAVGWRRNTAFEPLSVAMELTAPPNRPASESAHQLARFGADRTYDEPLDDGPLAQAVARAQRRAAIGAGDNGESLSWAMLGSS